MEINFEKTFKIQVIIHSPAILETKKGFFNLCCTNSRILAKIRIFAEPVVKFKVINFLALYQKGKEITNKIVLTNGDLAQDKLSSKFAFENGKRNSISEYR